jgi:tetratricopeptide (TPR) repeat protein
LIDYAKTASPAVSPRDLGQALKYRGDCLYDQRNYDAAYADYKKAAIVDPQDSGYDYRMAGECCRDQKRYNEALKLFALAVPVGSEALELHYDKGLCLSEMKRYPEAIAEFDQTVEPLVRMRQKSPERFTALLRDVYAERAHCHDALGQKAAAEADRRSLNEFARGWEQDLFGDSITTAPHK